MYVYIYLAYIYIYVRETGVSRHQGGTIVGPPDAPQTITAL